jgi:hypothetical protein
MLQPSSLISRIQISLEKIPPKPFLLPMPAKPVDWNKVKIDKTLLMRIKNKKNKNKNIH